MAGDFIVFTNLTNIYFPASVNIGEVNTFVECASLTVILKGKGNLSTIEDGRALVRNGSELVSYPNASGSITLNNITTIGRSAFNRTKIESISLPDTTIVGVRTFLGCENLRTVNLPSARDIGDEAFYGNISLETLNIPEAFTIGNNAIANSGGKTLTITLEQRMYSIGTGMFNEVDRVKNVIVRTPSFEAETITAMRDAFRGRGWNNGAFTLDAQWVSGTGWNRRTGYNYNRNINFTVQGY
jgi:hypothetical protein